MKTHLGDNTFLCEDVPNYIMNAIHDEIETSSFSMPYQHGLAGNIKKEYLVETCFDDIAPYIETKAQKYKGERYRLTDLWINFMKKHEFNPCHTHGGDLSFVIFVQVPYNIEDEYAMFSESNAPCAGHFFFQYCDILGKIAEEQIPVDSSFENKMVMFPAGLRHGVYPFYTSDKYRITVAGNLERI
jgi:hypothetical protein